MIGDKILKLLMHADIGNVGQVLDQVAQKAKKTDESLRELGNRTPASPQGAATLPAPAAPLPNTTSSGLCAASGAKCASLNSSKRLQRQSVRSPVLCSTTLRSMRSPATAIQPEP